MVLAVLAATVRANGQGQDPQGNIMYNSLNSSATDADQDTSTQDFAYTTWNDKMDLTDVEATSIWVGGGNEAWDAQDVTCLLSALLSAGDSKLFDLHEDNSHAVQLSSNNVEVEWICCGDCQQYNTSTTDPSGKIYYTTVDTSGTSYIDDDTEDTKTHILSYSSWNEKQNLTDISATTIWIGKGNTAWNDEDVTCLLSADTGENYKLFTLHEDNSYAVQLSSTNVAVPWICCGDCAQYNSTTEAAPSTSTIALDSLITGPLTATVDVVSSLSTMAATATGVVPEGAAGAGLDRKVLASQALLASATVAALPPPTNGAVHVRGGVALGVVPIFWAAYG